LQLVRDIQVHQKGRTLLSRHTDMVYAIAQGAAAAAAWEDVDTAQAYLFFLVPSLQPLLASTDMGLVQQAAMLCVDTLCRLMHLESTPQVIDTVLLHMSCIVQQRSLFHHIMRSSSNVAGKLCDLLCRIRMACNGAQKHRLHALLETMGPELRTAACTGAPAAVGREVVQAVLGMVAHLTREEQLQWSFVVGVLIAVADGVFVLDVLPYMTQIGWDGIFARLHAREGEFTLPWSSSKQEFQQSRDALLAHVARGLDEDNVAFLEFALHFCVTCTDPVWCLSGQPAAGLFVQAFVGFLRRHLAAPAPLRQANASSVPEEQAMDNHQQQQQQQQEQHQAPAAAAIPAELVDKCVIHIMSTAAGCQLLDRTGLWPAVGHHSSVRGESWEWNWGSFGPAYAHLAGAGASVLGPFLQQVLTTADQQLAHCVVRHLIELGMDASNLFPPKTPDTHMLELVLRQLQPNSSCYALRDAQQSFEEDGWLSDAHDVPVFEVYVHMYDHLTAEELLLAAAASPELAAAVRKVLEDPSSSQQVRRGALLALTAVLRQASPETQSMVDGFLDQMAQPLGLLSRGLDVWSRLVDAATSDDPSSAVVADAPAEVAAAALQERIQQLQQEKARLEAELASLKPPQA
jgi:hypothetical protein